MTQNEFEIQIRRQCDRVLSGNSSRSEAAIWARTSIGKAEINASTASLRGLSLLSGLDLQDRDGRFIVALASLAEWRERSAADWSPSHWWTAVLPFQTSPDPIKATDFLEKTIEDDFEGIELVNPTEYYTTLWTPDIVHAVKSVLKDNLPDSPAWNTTMRALVYDMEEWLNWLNFLTRDHIIDRVQKIVDAITTQDANYLYQTIQDDRSGQAVFREISSYRGASFDRQAVADSVNIEFTGTSGSGSIVVPGRTPAGRVFNVRVNFAYDPEYRQYYAHFNSIEEPN